MIDELVELVNKYNNKKTIVDEKFIIDACTIILNYYNLDNYLQVIKVNNTKSSYYYPGKKELNIFTNYKKQEKMLKKELNDEFFYWYNLRVLLTILHEMEHVKQESISEDTLEGKIIKLNNSISKLPSFYSNVDIPFKEKMINTFKIISYGKYYNTKKNHNLAPVERMANINSYNEIIKITSKLKKDLLSIESFKIYANISLLSLISLGYRLNGEFTNSPSYDFLNKIKVLDKGELYNNQELFTNVDFPYEKRLTLGLVLTKEEYRTLEKNKKDFYSNYY